jgi:hypothetical protein
MAAVAISTAAFAQSTTLYTDPATGQVYTQDGDNRVKMGEFVDAKTLEKSEERPTVINEKSPDFLLGKETAPNMKFRAFDDPDMWIKLGVRLQGTFQNVQSEKDGSSWDFFLRRTRFEASVGFSKHVSFTMDIRDDKVNYEDKGEQTFNVGDAYLKISKPFDTSLVNFRLYRGKIDVSRDETVKSAWVLYYDRPHVADEAAQFISHNRRAANVMMYGDWKKKVHYQIAAGDGVYSGKFVDASGNKFAGSDFSQANLFYGGKVVLSPFDGWEETKRTETYFAKGKHFEVGAAYWVSPHISFNDTSGVSHTLDHKLLNLEMSAHYKGAFIQAEWFQFDGVVQNWTHAKTGKSNGWYTTGEYVFEDLAYLAPFFRYESWDRWESQSGYDLTSTVGGVNWYLRGNSTKVGLVMQQDRYGKALGDYTDNIYKVTTQWFF